MKNTLAGSITTSVAIVLLSSLLSCDQNAIATKKATADKKAVGHWNLVSITLGWTGKTNPPTEKIQMSIDEQQQAIVYKEGTEVSHFQYTLEETTSETLFFRISQQGGTFPIYFPEQGYFKVSSKQLIMDSTPNDGPGYTFEHN